jgi:para-nitrobenzyl esterase
MQITKGDVSSLVSSVEMTSSEDCLYLNIWRPMKSGSFPVMFWIHGGGFAAGTGATSFYWGDRIVEQKDVVLVTINYRLGPLGFLSHRDLAAEDPQGGSGNYGMLDQIRALEWVRKNIAGFGGDPDNVTIFGESAGGFSVCTLLASPLAKGLFQRAIMESGACWGALSEQEGFDDGDKYAGTAGCAGADVPACLRAKPPEEILDAGAALQKAPYVSPYNPTELINFIFVPHVDGHCLEATPVDALPAGNFNNVPLLVGTNRDEIKAFGILAPGFRNMLPPQVDRYMLKIIDKDSLKDFKKVYAYSSYRRPADAAYDAVGDMFLGCSSFEAAEHVSAYQENVYYYRFDFDEHRAPHFLGAPHVLEIPFVFGYVDVSPAKLLFNKKQLVQARELSAAMMSYWTNFAYYGDPNGPGLPAWPQYNTDTRERIYLDRPIHSGPTDNVEKCGFWEEESRSVIRKFIDKYIE